MICTRCLNDVEIIANKVYCPHCKIYLSSNPDEYAKNAPVQSDELDQKIASDVIRNQRKSLFNLLRKLLTSSLVIIIAGTLYLWWFTWTPGGYVKTNLDIDTSKGGIVSTLTFKEMFSPDIEGVKYKLETQATYDLSGISFLDARFLTFDKNRLYLSAVKSGSDIYAAIMPIDTFICWGPKVVDYKNVVKAEWTGDRTGKFTADINELSKRGLTWDIFDENFRKNVITCDANHLIFKNNNVKTAALSIKKWNKLRIIGKLTDLTIYQKDGREFTWKTSQSPLDFRYIGLFSNQPDFPHKLIIVDSLQIDDRIYN